jgi:WD40 repeat protein
MRSSQILDAELDALPEQARQLLIACYLQGKTHVEAAAELGLPLGSVAWRLERARVLLATRLARRGITVSASLLAVLLEESVKGAGVPAVVLVHTLEAAGTFAEQGTGALSANVARLVKGGLTQMTRGWTHWNLALVGWVSLLGAGLLACQSLKAWPDQKPESEPSAAEGPTQDRDKSARTDRYGDPLPPGALARLGTVRLRHAEGVHSLAFTRDGKGLITAGGKKEPIRLWDVATGRMLRQFGGGGEPIVGYTAALSADGRTLAGSVGAAGDLGLWDVDTGMLLRRLKGCQASEPVLLAFSPDGKTVAAANGKTLRLWETATGKELWAAGGERITALTYSADSKSLIWSGLDGDLHLWDAAEGKELRRWDDAKKRPIFALARAPNGLLFTAHHLVDRPGEVRSFARLWDAATGKEVWHQTVEEASITTARFSPDGKVLAIYCLCQRGGPIRLWDAATGKELRHCGSQSASYCLAFSPDGKTLAAASGVHTVHLWDVSSGRQIRHALVGHEREVCSVTFTPDGKDIVSITTGSLRVWDAATGRQRRQVLPIGGEYFVVGRCGVSPEGKPLISAAWYGSESKHYVKVRRWDRDTGRELPGWSHEVDDSYSSLIIISPDGKTVSCPLQKDAPNSVRRWETGTGTELPSVAGGYPAFSPDGKLLATAPLQLKQDEPGSFTLWESATGKELCSIPVPEGHVHRLLFSSDGRMLATASNTGSQPSMIDLWPLLRDESRKSAVRVGPPRLLAAEIPSFPVFAAWAFSPDGRTLAFSGKDGTIQLVETASGKERGRFLGHGGHIWTLSFAPDGRRLASGSRDTTILVWDITGRLQEGRLRPAQLSDKELEKLWADLASDDARRAGRAIWTLAAAPAVPYLGERLRTAAVNAKAQMVKVPQLLRDLDDDAFAVRAKAKAELARLGAAVEPALRQALEKSPSAEMRRSLEQLLKAMEAEHQAPSGESLRAVRALEVLEQIGSREAREVLKALVAGDPAELSTLTQEAHAALERLDRAERR